MALIACVPNISEGCGDEVVRAIVGAARGIAGVRVLDVSSDRSHTAPC